jgi:hypothetical protein
MGHIDRIRSSVQHGPLQLAQHLGRRSLRGVLLSLRGGSEKQGLPSRDPIFLLLSVSYSLSYGGLVPVIPRQDGDSCSIYERAVVAALLALCSPAWGTDMQYRQIR